jgi:hypothetical protein
MPEASAVVVDTSMHTDAYDPEDLSAWVATDDSADDARSAVDHAMQDTAEVDLGDLETSPIDLGDVRAAKQDARAAAREARETPEPDADHDADAVADAERASEAALRRWLAE